IRFFSDKKFFCQINAKSNRCQNQSEEWLTYNSEDVPIVARTKFSANVHVLDIVFSVMLPHFFKKEETVTKEVYLRVLMDVVKPRMKTVASGRPYVFQQDGLLSDNVDIFWSKEFWPPNSSDSNPVELRAKLQWFRLNTYNKNIQKPSTRGAFQNPTKTL
ncbi:hypothetical protein ALC53_05464, partial [Atta colombica]